MVLLPAKVIVALAKSGTGVRMKGKGKELNPCKGSDPNKGSNYKSG